MLTKLFDPLESLVKLFFCLLALCFNLPGLLLSLPGLPFGLLDPLIEFVSMLTKLFNLL